MPAFGISKDNVKIRVYLHEKSDFFIQVVKKTSYHLFLR